MNLVLDIGNTRIKAGLFDGDELVRKSWSQQPTREWLAGFIQKDHVQSTLFCASGLEPEWLPAFLTPISPWRALDHRMALPFVNKYETPETLGRDRIAAVAGALSMGLKPPLLVIDAGTCITVNFLDRHLAFAGGSISPGIGMRAKAMHAFTQRLPQIDWKPEPVLTGANTSTSLNAGVFMGAVCEIEGMIARYKKRAHQLQICMTGGDGPDLANALKYPIFAVPDLVLLGLNHILRQHAADD